MGTQFKQRLLMSLLGFVLLAVAIYFSHSPFFKPFFALFNASLISLALIEYYRLAQHKGYQPLLLLGIGATTAYVIASFLALQFSTFKYLPELILLGALILFFLAFFNQPKDPIVNLAITVFGIVYLTLPLTCALKITYFSTPDTAPHGRLWLTYALVLTKATDMGAYFFGKLWGRTKLASQISPKKTIEGAVGGLIFTLIASYLFYRFFLPSDMHLTLWQALWVGLLISVLGQLGDLAESILKRDAGVKDSNTLPGLGGMLDIVDSLVFTLPLMYVLLQMKLVG